MRLENGLTNSAGSADEPKSEPLPETPSLLPADSNGPKKSILRRQQSLVILPGNPDPGNPHRIFYRRHVNILIILIIRFSFLRASA